MIVTYATNCDEKDKLTGEKTINIDEGYCFLQYSHDKRMKVLF